MYEARWKILIIEQYKHVQSSVLLSEPNEFQIHRLNIVVGNGNSSRNNNKYSNSKSTILPKRMSHFR